MTRIAIVGPVYPYRAGVAHCTTRLAETLAERSTEIEVHVESFKRQYPARFYPGGDDRDETLAGSAPSGSRFALDILNPLSWLSAGLRLRRGHYDAVVFVWWIWVWGLPYLTIRALVGKRCRVVHQCHNVSDKEPSWWKSGITNMVLRGSDLAVVHAGKEADEIERRLGSNAPRIHRSFLPVHELGGEIPSRIDARRALEIEHDRVVLFFGHIRPFKGLDLALRGWADVDDENALLLIAGEPWWGGEETYRALADSLGLDRTIRFDFRFVPDDEVASYFAASDFVMIPYRREAQSGVALTAFYFGRPVIATAIGGLKEIVVDGENGVLVEPENPTALADGIRRAFDLDSEPLERGAAKSARRYSWRRYASELLEALEL